MNPGSVLYIRRSLMDHPANREAAEAALHVLPGACASTSPVIGIPRPIFPPMTRHVNLCPTAFIYKLQREVIFLKKRERIPSAI